MIPQKPKPPRNKILHDTLRATKGGAHEERRPRFVKRSKARDEFRQLLCEEGVS